jgi:heterodisulfide reductase subunit A-like polyferredoxin
VEGISPKGKALVVGGGIAGIQAALDLSELGYYVYLVEKKPRSVGLWLSLIRPSPPTTAASEYLPLKWWRPVGLPT